ncbi:MAG: sulfotransferase domain-containing protein [Halioglobus sp.]|nr:sulfotransferase domain-containing protein [Halioglobus sp.]
MNFAWNRWINYLKSFDSLKAAVWKAVIAFGRVTRNNRDLPSFIIIGAQKAGTTSLFSYLSQHPELMPSIKKEIHFFDGGRYPWVDGNPRAEAWYRAQFPYQSSKTRRKKTFEASPFYLFNPETPRRIHAWMPEVKLIALLRNPSERAISHYFHGVRKDREPLAMQAAFEAEEARLEESLAKKDYESFAFRKYSYKLRGRYKEQLERYFEVFDRKQILVLCSESFFADPRHNLNKVCKFLGIAEEFALDNLAPANVGGNRSDVAPATYQYLNDYFKPYNEQLFEFLGERYNWP